MVLGVIIKGVSIAAPVLARYAIRYGRAEGRVFARLYGTSRGRGVRHGLAAGGVAGSLLNQGGPNQDDATVPFKDVPSSNKSNQARGGSFRNSYRSRSNKKYSCRCHRYSNSRKQFRGRNR